MDSDQSISDDSSTQNDISRDDSAEFLNPNILRIEKQSNSNKSNSEEKVSSKQLLDQKEKEKCAIKSPAQMITEKMTPLPYKEPSWSGLPNKPYSFDVLKGGIIIKTISFDKPFLAVGRFTHCDLDLQHPSISRYHCIIQFRAEASENDPPGIYVYDLDSTHGTFQNKHRLQPLVYNRLHVGHILHFGGSSRMFILQGPPEDQEAESQYTVTELKALAEERKKKIDKLQKLEEDNEENNSKTDKAVSAPTSGEGINWGMGDDATEDDNEEMNPFATNEDLYLEDPKKTLRGWFEREGYDFPHYEASDISPGHFKCKVEIPIPDNGSSSITCVVEHKGKKKESVIQCALEACRILDRRGLLRQATHESHKRAKKDWSENDYYASDEDEFLDRTGDIEHKRRMRKRQSDSSKTKVDTYESLSKEYEKVSKEIERIEFSISKANKVLHHQKGKSDQDIDEYMKNISSSALDRQKILNWKVEVNKLRKEEERLRQLINVARPFGVDELLPKPEQSRRNDDKQPKVDSNLHSLPKSQVTLKSALNSEPKHSSFASVKPKPSGVHHLFLEAEEPKTMKLTKVDFNDDSSSIKAIPYDRGQRRPHKYAEMLKKEKEKETVVAVTDLQNNSEQKDDSLEFEPSEELKMEVDSDALLPPANLVPEVPPRLTEPTTHDSLKHQSDTGEDFRKPVVEFKPKAKKKKADKPNPFSFDKEYESWVPPTGQTGDGRTALNDKLGY